MLNYFSALPEIFLLAAACVVMLVDLFVPQQEGTLTYILAQVSLALTAGLVIWFYPHQTTISFYNQFISDPISGLLKIFILATSFFSFVYARDYIKLFSIPRGEYYILGLFSVVGMMVLVSSYNFLTLYLGLELMSLPLYAMVAIQRHSGNASEAAMKYFVMGSLASAMLLYGLSMLYGATQSLDIATVAHAVQNTPASQQLILVFGLVFVLAGIAFKLGAAPFHMWIPDVYQGAPTSVTLFVGSAPKIAALGMAFRLLIMAMPSLLLQWHEILIVIAVVSISLGNIVAIVQSNLKRMLGYSAIAHIGYMTLGLIAGTPNGYAAAMLYIIAYSIMTLGAFGILVLLSRAGFDAELIADLRGLNARNPWLAFMMLLVMFSMAGIPPTVGFFAKLGVLESVIAIHMVWLATFALVFAIVGAYYYLNVVKVMYFEEPVHKAPVKYSGELQLAISLNGLIVLYLGLFPSGLINMCRAAFAL